MNKHSISGPDLLAQLRSIVGRRYVLTDDRDTQGFRRGYRYGEGQVLAVVRPGKLLEQWRVFKACIEAGRIVIMQAANTGLNGGSTPYGDDYDVPLSNRNNLAVSSSFGCILSVGEALAGDDLAVLGEQQRDMSAA